MQIETKPQLLQMHKLLSILCITVWLLIYNQSLAQVNENFSDGDFTANPAWSGNTSDWLINPSLQLQSNNTTANSTFYITTASTLATQAQWEMYVNLAFNPSGLNYVDIFLTASQSDLANAAVTGYFVRVGNTDDEVSLYRKDANGNTVKLIDGVNNILNTSNNVLKIKVQRSAGNQWTLFRDLSGTGTNYVSEGSFTDATYTTSSFFGFLVRQSTSGFFQKHFFDDILVTPYVPDVTPPAIQSTLATGPQTLDVLFNEPVELSSSQTITNYSASGNVGNPVQAVRDASNTALVHLSFATNFPNGVINTLTINGVKDLAGNASANATAQFSFYTPQRYDIIIDEILADPTPAVSLPSAEYIELKNTSNQSINIQGWRIASATTSSNTFPSYILPPDSFVVMTSPASAALFSSYGRVMGIIGFPALDNTGTTLSLISKENTIIHSVSYSADWYQNAVKSEGGWSLEMIDTKNPCSGASNWKASVNIRGGTPASKNSVDGNNPDQAPPALLRAAATDSVTLVLTFDEPLDSLKAATVANYTISDGVNRPASAITFTPAFNKVQLKLGTALVREKVYTITATNVSDCRGNVINTLNTARVGLPGVLDSLGVVINEVLFNPKADGVDYVEIYNRSSKIFDLKDMYIANRLSSNQVANLRQLSAENLQLFPGDFFVISENGAIVKQQYIAKNPANFVDVSSMPSFNDDKGTVVLLNAFGNVVDELRYDKSWHFALIDNDEGIALERIDYNKPTQNKDNWHSAASAAGFGTPSYQNSQFRNDLQIQGEVTVTPKVFSPDNDGMDDFALITYQLPEPGYVANITIFDAAGRPVKALVKNATLASTGSFRWDGLDDKLRKVLVGAYIIYTEVFNLSGKKRSFKNTVVVAVRF